MSAASADHSTCPDRVSDRASGPGSRPGLALVTGASGGIGETIATELAHAGYSLLLQCHRRQEAVEELAERLRETGVAVSCVRADLGSLTGVDVVCARAQQLSTAGDPLTLIVNNAGALLSPAFGDTRPEDFEHYFAVNVRAPFFLVQHLSQLMPPESAIVNVSSASAHFSSPGDITYAMSKAALESFTANAAEPLAARGIRINTVIPGFTNNGYALFDDEAALAYMDGFGVLGGVADPSDVAAAVLFLASHAARRTTGTSLDVTGGSLLGARGKKAHSVRSFLSEDR